MATYVISDIHGEYDMLMDLLEKRTTCRSFTFHALRNKTECGILSLAQCVEV